MKVIVACEFSAVVRDAFRRRGHDAWSIDLLETEGDPAYHIVGDVLSFLDKHYEYFDLMIAHPPCTRLSNSGARWLIKPPAGKTLDQIWKELEEAVYFYKKLRDIKILKKAIENPIMHCHASSRIIPGKRHIIQPWWFGIKEFKATGFELFNLPELIPTNKLNPPKSGTEEHKQWSKVHREAPGPNRWKNRSRTKLEVAEAMAIQWGGWK